MVRPETDVGIRGDVKHDIAPAHGCGEVVLVEHIAVDDGQAVLQRAPSRKASRPVEKLS